MKLIKEEREPVLANETAFAEANDLEIVYAAGKDISLSSVSVNRPEFVLSGYTDYFAPSRVQVIGKNEMTYLSTVSPELRRERLELLFSAGIPCVTVTRGQRILKDFTDLAQKYEVPLFRSKKVTAVVVNDLFMYLNELLAPMISVHAILLDVFGVGVLITGESGIGKSETALELIHRGHRFVSDDIVELKEVNQSISGSSPVITRDMMEIRGLGIIDIKAMYGVSAVLKKKKVDIVIELEKWQEEKDYIRLDGTQLTENLLGVAIPKYVMPVIPGRNLAVLIEVAVRDFRLKQDGYNALEELNKRMR